MHNESYVVLCHAYSIISGRLGCDMGEVQQQQQTKAAEQEAVLVPPKLFRFVSIRRE